jgi:hypothetical protein
VEQEILTLPEHLKSLPTFSGVRDGRSLIIGKVWCTSLFVFSVFFFAMVLSDLLRCMSFDYPFGIFTLSSLLNEYFIWDQFIPFINAIDIHNAILFLLRTNYKVG